MQPILEVKAYESPFRLKLESSILQINMLEDKKREEESYYNEKYRLSDEIDHLKNIIRGMQIDKIKASPTPYSQSLPKSNAASSRRIKLHQDEEDFDQF
jgi:hypothetical protein